MRTGQEGEGDQVMKASVLTYRGMLMTVPTRVLMSSLLVDS